MASPTTVKNGSSYGTVSGGEYPAPSHGDPKWVASLKAITGAAPVSSERLDVAKMIFITLVCAGHFVEPFYKIGNKPTQVFMHVIYGFHVPAFVLISGYVSGDLNAQRRRALIGGIVVPFLALHVLYSVAYTKLFCEGDHVEFHVDVDEFHGTSLVPPQRPKCELVNHWSLVDPKTGTWDGWDGWTFAYPFAQLWYLVSLVTKRVWRPFALEMRYTLLVHLVLGVLVGYTTIGRFLSLHRSCVHMPYFLCGFLMKKHACFFPEARGFLAKTFSTFLLAVIFLTALTATYGYDLNVEYWFQSDPHDAVYGENWGYGAVFQLALYAWTFFAMTVVFALVPEPTSIGVSYPGHDDDGGETAGLISSAASKDPQGKKSKAVRRVGRYGKERDQTRFATRAYLRLAKWGSRTLYPFVLHIAIFMLLAKYTDWYEMTWHVDGADGEVTARFVLTLIMAVVTVVFLSLKPVTFLFKWLLEPSLGFLYSPETQKC